MTKWCADISFSIHSWRIGGEADYVQFAAAIVDRHITAFARVFAICEKLVHEVGKGEATLFKDTSLSVLTEYNVFGNQSRG